jgi:hypothetical protein
MLRGLKKFPAKAIHSRLSAIAAQNQILNACEFHRSLKGIVNDYLQEMSPSEFANEIRQAYRTGDLRKVKKYLPPQPKQYEPTVGKASKKANLPSAQNLGKVRPSDLLVAGQRWSLTRKGRRPELKTTLIGQVAKGFPGRAPELIMTSRLAALWVRHGGTVSLGGGTYSRGKDWQPSEFEKLVDDVLVAIGIDDKCSPRSLVRAHLNARRNT